MTTVDPSRPAPLLRCAIAAASLVGAAGVCTVVGGLPAGRAVAPVFVTTVVTGALAIVLLSATRRSAAAVAAIGAVATLFAAIDATVPGTTVLGVPTADTVRVLRHGAVTVRAAVTGGVPYPAVTGLVVIGSLTAGLAALAAQLLFSVRDPRGTREADHRLLALAPPFLLVLWASVVGSLAVATWLAVAFFLIASCVIALPGQRTVRTPSGRHGTGPRWFRRPLPSSGPLLGTLAILAAIVTGASAEAATATSNSSGASAAPTSALQLLSSVSAVERTQPASVLFTARTTVPTYWELATLSTFDGSAWVPSHAMRSTLDGGATPVSVPPTLPTTRSGTYRVSVRLASLAGPLLPLPPDTLAVTAPFGVARVEGGALATSAPAPPVQYAATAIAPAPITTSPGATGGPPADSGEFLALPPLPPALHALALAITADASDPTTSALLLENWFRSGTFHYALRPPPTPAGGDPLVRFLDVTRTGTCEQFAGAFAVLAREVGLPTRIVVGFTTGTRSADGTTVVRGVDAHAWPEVYLGRSAGWVSFEPTPARPAGEITPASIVGPTGVPAPTSVTTPTTVPTFPTTPPTTPPPAPTTLPVITIPTSTTPSVPPTGGGADGSIGWELLAAIVLALAVFALLVGRRRRAVMTRRREEALDPVAHAWSRIERALDASGLHRPRGRSPSTWIAGIAASIDLADARTTERRPSPSIDVARSVAADAVTVAGLLDRSLFAPVPLDDDEIALAVSASARVVTALRNRDLRSLLRTCDPGDGRPTTTGTSAMIRT